MAVAFVRSLVSHAQFNGATMALTVPSAGVALGDFMVLCYGVANDYTIHVTGIADNHSGTTNAWTEAVHFPTAAGVTATTYIWYAPVTTALVSGDIITVTLSGAPGAGEACSISVFSGVNMVAPVDQTHSSGADNTNTYSTGATGTLATTGELVIACANTSRGNRNVQVASSYSSIHTNISSGTGFTDTVLTAMYRIESGTTAQSASASNGLSTLDSSACIATFYPAGFGPGTVTYPYDGVLDEWGLWGRILTDAEADERYNNGFGSTSGGGGSPLNPPNPPTPTVSIPSGSTANRPIIGGSTGQLYFNTDINTLEYWDGSAWQPAAPAVADYILESIVDAKGDLLAGTADNTIARVAVGSDGKVLTANSGATPGVSWETPTVYAPANAHYVTSQAESGLSAELVLGTAVIMAGNLASIPAAGIAGRLYWVSDVNGGTLYRDNGSNWILITRGLDEVILNALITAKGDLIAGTGSAAMDNVPVGSDGKVLTADSGASTGVSWQTPSAGSETDPLSIHNSLIDAKGDLIAGTADNTPARVAVGTNGYLLKADSGATPGVSWVDPAGIDTGAIPKSLVDVKGDLIAATADNTVARKAAGADGTFLRPKAANSDGLEWYDHEGAADPHPGYVLESLFDAKGDLLAASADNTPSKVTVGTNGKVLTADSTATGGVSWQDAPSGNTSSVGNKLYLATHYQ